MVSNEWLWGVMLLLDFGLLLALYRYLGKLGLFMWIPIATILANVQVIKLVEMWGQTATLGNIAYASIFLATDILSENHSRRDATLAVVLGFVTMLATVAVMSLAVAFTPAAADFSQQSLQTIFGVMPRVLLGSLTAYVISQFSDIHIYHFFKRVLPSVRWLWVRNNVSTLTSQLLDTLIFTTIAFVGLFPPEVFWSIVWTTYVLKVLIALLDTPLLYLARRIHQKGLVPVWDMR